MILIDYAPPKHTSRRDLLDLSHAYSTLRNEEGRAELVAIARQVGIWPRRVRVFAGLASLIVDSAEVHRLKGDGARIGTPEEIRALFQTETFSHARIPASPEALPVPPTHLAAGSAHPESVRGLRRTARQHRADSGSRVSSRSGVPSEPSPGLASCATHGDYDTLMSPEGCPSCEQEDFRAVQARPSAPAVPSASWAGLRLRRRGIRPKHVAPEPPRSARR